MQKHWTSFLPEVGDQITKKGIRQTDLLDEIAENKKRMHALNALHAKRENEILTELAGHWSHQEIEDAQAAALASK